jgi:hypothetical protein
VEAELSSTRAGRSSGSTKTLGKRVARLTGTVKEASLGLSGGSYAVPPVKGHTSFSRINGEASALLEMVEATSDEAPVPALYRTYSQLCRDFNVTLSAWQALRAQVAGSIAGMRRDEASAGSLASCPSKTAT